MSQDRGLSEPERRCIASGQVLKKADLIRFVVAPDGVLVPDLQEKLPGRGIWLSSSREHLELARKKGLFSRAARQKVSIPDDLENRVELGLMTRCMNLLGLARKRGDAVSGFAKVEASLRKNKAGLLLAARDGAPDGRKKLKTLAGNLPVVELFNSQELSQALGLENVIHAALPKRGYIEKFLIEASKLSGFRCQDADVREPGRSSDD